MRVGSLFSGIGGLDLGLERAGMEVAWQVEWELDCHEVLERHWPDVPKFFDVRDVWGHDLVDVDVVCGGFPCQPVSQASNVRKGEADERWMWPEFSRIIEEVEPKYVIIENVPGLRKMGLRAVLGDLADLGFDAEWQSVTAEALGAPQIRQRLFIVAYARHLRAPQRGEHEDAASEGSHGPADAGGGSQHHRQGRDARTREPEGSPFIFTEPPSERASHWMEHRVPGVAHGPSGRMDGTRLKQVGNAVVPQVAEYIGTLVMRAEQGRTCQ